MKRGRPIAPPRRGLERRDLIRAVARGNAIALRRIADEWVATFLDASAVDREGWFATGWDAATRRDDLLRTAREARKRCEIEDPDDPLTRALLETTKALMILAHDKREGLDPVAIRKGIDERIGTLAGVLKKRRRRTGGGRTERGPGGRGRCVSRGGWEVVVGRRRRYHRNELPEASGRLWLASERSRHERRRAKSTCPPTPNLHCFLVLNPPRA